MTTSAWIMMFVTWSVVTAAALRCLYRVVRTKRSADEAPFRPDR
jgi:hypothetical protein